MLFEIDKAEGEEGDGRAEDGEAEDCEEIHVCFTLYYSAIVSFIDFSTLI